MNAVKRKPGRPKRTCKPTPKAREISLLKFVSNNSKVIRKNKLPESVKEKSLIVILERITADSKTKSDKLQRGRRKTTSSTATLLQAAKNSKTRNSSQKQATSTETRQENGLEMVSPMKLAIRESIKPKRIPKISIKAKENLISKNNKFQTDASMESTKKEQIKVKNTIAKVKPSTTPKPIAKALENLTNKKNMAIERAKITKKSKTEPEKLQQKNKSISAKVLKEKVLNSSEKLSATTLVSCISNTSKRVRKMTPKASENALIKKTMIKSTKDDNLKNTTPEIANRNKRRNLVVNVENKISMTNKPEKGKNTPVLVTKNLRTRRTKNYAEISTNLSQKDKVSTEPVANANKEKVPIYKRKVEETKAEAEKDLYEFVSDSEKKKLKKRNKNKTDLYDKTMHNILQKIMKDVDKKKKTTGINKITTKAKNTVVKPIPKTMLQNAPVKSKNTTKIIPKSNSTDVKLGKKVEFDGNFKATQKQAGVSMKNDNALQSSENISSGNEDFFGFSNDNEEGIFSTLKNNPEINRKNIEVDDNLKAEKIATEHEPVAKAGPSNERNDSTSHSDEEINKNLQPSISTSEENEEFFGFSDDNEGLIFSPRKNKPKINIIQNIVVRKSILSPTEDSFKYCKPNANSTVLHTTVSPWRYNPSNIIRNPHFLKVKTSALPSINQEMILDSSQIDRFPSCRRLVSKKKRPVQQSMLDFVNSTACHDFDETCNNSLFDVDKLSPIKVGGVATPVSRASAVKRNPFAPRNENVAATPVPESISAIEPENYTQQRDVSFFGFNSEDEIIENKENTPKSGEKPFRADFKTLKKYNRAMQKSVVHQVDAVEDAVEEDLTIYGDNEDNSSGKEENQVPVGLFEDPCNSPPKLHEKKKRRVRYQSEDDSDNEQPKRKKKNTRVKAEEAAYNKWAEEFNSICEEIDKHELEID